MSHSDTREPELISAAEAHVRVAEGARLIDVRGAAGRSAAGTIPAAEAVDREKLDETFAGAPKDAPIVVVCGSVNGSGPVAAWLVENGFSAVAHVDGGFPAWREEGLPVEAPQA